MMTDADTKQIMANLSDKLPEEIIAIFAMAIQKSFEKHKAENYLELISTDGEVEYLITIQHKNGLSPDEKGKAQLKLLAEYVCEFAGDVFGKPEDLLEQFTQHEESTT